MSVATVEPLRFRDHENTFAVAVASCPAHIALREAIQNAFEAATHPDYLAKYGPDAGEVRLTRTPGEEIEPEFSGRKVGVLSYGIGMTEKELESYTDIGAGIKARGVGKNYGIGMKLAGLAASPAGVVIYTYVPPVEGEAGLVYRVVLCAADGEADNLRFGRRRFEAKGDDGRTEAATVVNFPISDYPKRDASRPWTEVVFIGTTPDADTVKKLYPPHEELRAAATNWTMAAINCRYYRTPLTVHQANVSAEDPKSSKRKEPRNANGLRPLIESWTSGSPQEGGRLQTIEAKHETYGRVRVTFGLLDGTDSCSETLRVYGIPVEAKGCGHAALIYQNEVYNHRFGQRWPGIASKFGLAYGQRRLVVHIELIEDRQHPNQDRTELKARASQTGHDGFVRLEEFADLVKELVPEWVREYMAEAASKSYQSRNLKEELRSLIDQLKAQDRTAHRVDPGEGEDEGSRSDLDIGRRERQNRSSDRKQKKAPALQPTRGRASEKKDIVPPDIVWVTIENSDGKFSSDMQGAHYDHDASQGGILRMNEEYRGYVDQVAHMVQRHGVEDDPDAVGRVREAVRDEFGWLVGQYIVTAAYNRNRGVITQNDLTTIFDPNTIVCVATTVGRQLERGALERFDRMTREARRG